METTVLVIFALIVVFTIVAGIHSSGQDRPKSRKPLKSRDSSNVAFWGTDDTHHLHHHCSSDYSGSDFSSGDSGSCDGGGGGCGGCD